MFLVHAFHAWDGLDLYDTSFQLLIVGVTTSQASNFLSAVDGLTPSNASVFQVLYSPVLYSPTNQKINQKHPKNPSKTHVFSKKHDCCSFSTSKNNVLKSLIPAWVTPGDSCVHSVSLVFFRPGSAQDPELTLPNPPAAIC